MDHFQLTDQQIQSFKTNGFIRIKNAVPPLLLAELQARLSEFNEQALLSYGTSSTPSNVGFLDTDGTPILTRVNDLVGVFPDAVLDLLGCPAMIAIARDLSGPGTIPLQCDALFKQVHPFSTVLWHQDAVHPRTFPYLNIGVYLDDADQGDGCLTYVKGSQHEKLDICALVKAHGWDIPNSEDVPAKAGDILIQDMMVLHGSRKKLHPGVRRTIYVEMRPAAAVVEQNLNSAAWTELRKRWMGIVARRSAVSWPENTHGELPKDLKSDREEIEQLLQLRESPIPANYCFEGTDMMD